MKNTVLKIILAVVLFFSSLISVAQPQGWPRNPIPDRGLPEPEANIDSVIVFLIVTAIGLGFISLSETTRKYFKKLI